MVQSKANDVDGYLTEAPEERRGALTNLSIHLMRTAFRRAVDRAVDDDSRRWS
ncbi:hypothetical protein [Streptomyces venezuelae]|uniref:hypothetical protein n=1 Tax=Streptomyces venezuelae TaxID=54571 RepID=UPI001686D4F8|nr:hypothetical protein [Streptomyces venezuelae]